MLLVVGLAAEIEIAAAGTGAELRTERECRQAHDDHVERWCVEVAGHGRAHKRWPDLVVQVAERRRAVELELAVKHSSRLRAIVEAYADGLIFDQVLWLVELPTQRERVRAIADDLGASQEVMAWPAPDAVAAAIDPFVDRGFATEAPDALEDGLPDAVTPRDGLPPPRVAAPQSNARADDELFSDEFVHGS